MQTVVLKLPPALLRAAQVRAAERDQTVGQIVRDLLTREVLQSAAAAPHRASPTDDRLINALQAYLALDLAEATGWGDLMRRLSVQGYALRSADEGLTLLDASTGERLCKASELGFAYGVFVRRFGCAMPGHPEPDPMPHPKRATSGRSVIEPA